MVGGGWTKTKLMLFSTQVEVVVELKLELSLAIKCKTRLTCWKCKNEAHTKSGSFMVDYIAKKE